jgi:hypothetical protein
VVVNLSKQEPDGAAISILTKGLNFVHTTNLTSDIKDVISGTERAVSDLLMEAAEKIRRETCRILKKTKTQKSNSSKAE